jgi:hypothetical protein
MEDEEWFPEGGVIIQTTVKETTRQSSRHGKLIPPTTMNKHKPKDISYVKRTSFNLYTNPIMWITWILLLFTFTLTMINFFYTPIHNIGGVIEKTVVGTQKTESYVFNVYDKNVMRYPDNKLGIPNTKWGQTTLISVCCRNVDYSQKCLPTDVVSLKHNPQEDSVHLEILHNNSLFIGSSCTLQYLNSPQPSAAVV